ncbi:MAG: phosphoglycerate kinase [Flavobacteriaceae bacterium]|nr:phosphoglycerate kinase [Flavobacteriaceae bacterium]
MITINDFNFKDKKALIRVDFNVPLNQKLEVTDTTRIEAVEATISKILKDGGKVILMSHLGRPKAKEDKFSLRHLISKVEAIIDRKVRFVSDCIGNEVETEVKNLKNGEILLLENLRFYKEEKEGNIDFAKQLAKLGDIYVNDAFGSAHRAHASTAIIAQFFSKNKCFGLLLAKEITSINQILNNSKKPVTAIIGGAKVASKIEVINHIMDKVDTIIIGGGMAFTFIKAQGGNIGNSLVEDDKLELALEILAKAKEKKTRIYLPIDVIAADAFSNDANTMIIEANEIPDGWMGLDTGPKTNIGNAFVIAGSKTILWNGPLGVFEMKSFEKGTKELGFAIIDATAEGAFSLVGGGDSVAAVKQFNFADKVSYVSTGGGAMLEMLEGRKLPGIEAILN